MYSYCNMCIQYFNNFSLSFVSLSDQLSFSLSSLYLTLISLSFSHLINRWRHQSLTQVSGWRHRSMLNAQAGVAQSCCSRHRSHCLIGGIKLGSQAKGIDHVVAQVIAVPHSLWPLPPSLTLSVKWVFGSLDLGRLMMMMVVARLNGYVNFIDGGLVEWDGGWVVVLLDDGGWVVGWWSVREMIVGKNEYFIE